MRFVPLLLFLLTLTPSLLAQEQEKSLMQRLERNPSNSKDLVFDTRQASFSTSRSFGTKNANSKSFFFNQKTSPGEFRSKEFSGAKSAWMGDFKFSAKQANPKGKFEVPNKGKQYNTKTMAVADAREAGKGMGVQEYEKGRRPYLGREAHKMKNVYTPATLPTDLDGELRPMTIDDIRELLNKNE